MVFYERLIRETDVALSAQADPRQAALTPLAVFMKGKQSPGVH